jgi:hypothetical protein
MQRRISHETLRWSRLAMARSRARMATGIRVPTTVVLMRGISSLVKPTHIAFSELQE